MARAARRDGHDARKRQLGTPSIDEIRAAAPDGAGGVYVAGSTQGSLAAANAGYSDLWVAHYDGAGNRLWIRQLGTVGGNEAYAAVADVGGVVLTGQTARNLDGSLGLGGNFDAFLVRFDDVCGPASMSTRNARIPRASRAAPPCSGRPSPRAST